MEFLSLCEQYTYENISQDFCVRKILLRNVVFVIFTNSLGKLEFKALSFFDV